MAKFSRSSTAYKQDGSVVAAGVPRFESNGVMVEEGTTNLLFVASQNKLINGTPNVTSAAISSGLIQGGSYTLSGNKCIFTDDDTVFPRINLFFSYSDGTYGNNVLANIPKDGNFHDFIVSAKADSTKTLTSIRWFLTDYSSGSFMHQEVKNCSLEAKPYPTSFHSTTRAAESLTIPASALNASEGTIEFDFIAPQNINAAGVSFLFECSNQPNAHRLYTRLETNRDILMGVGDGTNIQAINSGVKAIAGQKYRIGMQWSAKASLWINGVKYGTSPSNQSLILTAVARIGEYGGGGYQANTLFSNLRISNKARSDTELANTGALAVDEFTTYFLPMNGNLSATCHPVMLVQGQGQVLLSRVGRGTRSIKVQGSGQVKLKRSACYYPTIAVGTKGEVKLSRQGIGYRKMKVEGQGSFKIQEPNIEIYPEIREREATTTIVERQSTTEVIGVPYAGDTIKIKGTFKSFEGVLADPTGITLKVYDTINNLLTTISVTATDKVSAGVYEVNYTVPDGYQALYYEWHCVQGDSPQVTMGKITVLKRGQA